MEYYVNVKKNKFCLEKTRNVQLTVFERRTENQNMHDDRTELFPSAVWNFLRCFCTCLLCFVPLAFSKKSKCFKRGFEKKTKKWSGEQQQETAPAPKAEQRTLLSNEQQGWKHLFPIWWLEMDVGVAACGTCLGQCKELIGHLLPNTRLTRGSPRYLTDPSFC